MSAAMAGGLTAFLMTSFFIVLTIYSTALVAQYLGAGRPKTCGLVVTQAFIFSFAEYIPLLIFKSFGHWLFDLIGIEIAVTSMMGRYMGSKNPETANKSVFSGLKIACCYSMLMLILFLFFPRFLVEIFSPQQSDIIFQQAVPKAIFMLRVVFLYVFAELVFIVFTGALRGAGDTFWTMIISVILHWVMFLAAFILIKIFQIKIETVWITVVTIFVVFSYFIYLRYKREQWKNISVLAGEDISSIIDGFHEVDGLNRDFALRNFSRQ